MTLADNLTCAKKVAPGCPMLQVLVGFPASGKSTYAKSDNFANGSVVLSSDEIRAELFGSEEIQGNPAEVLATLKSRLKENLEDGEDVIVDATSINSLERSDYVKIAKECNTIPVAIVFDTPIEECKRRNQNRDRKVPDFVYDKMAAKYEEPSTDEGFSDVFHAC